MTEVNELMIEEGTNGRKVAPTGRSLNFQIKPGGTHEVQLSTPQTREKPTHAFANAPSNQMSYTPEGGIEYGRPNMVSSVQEVGMIPGEILSTSRTAAGRTINTISEVTPDSIVSIKGVETTVKNAIQQGFLQKDAQGNITDPTSEGWTKPETPKPGMVPVMSLIAGDVQANLNGLEGMIGGNGLNAALSSLIGAAVMSANDADVRAVDKARNLAEQTLNDVAYAASHASGRQIHPSDVQELVQTAFESAQGGMKAYCEHVGVDTDTFMDYLDSCSAGYKRSLYVSVLTGVGAQAIKHVITEMKNRNRN